MLPGCAPLESAAERGAQRATERKLEKDFKGEGVTNDEARTYGKYITFDVKAERVNDNQVYINGVVRNTGTRKVTFLKVQIRLLGDDGVQVAGRTDLLAHTFPFGENNTPILPGGAKRFGSPVDTSRWTGGQVEMDVIEIAIAPFGPEPAPDD
jgi:hypothetical protein